jgi:hypothetical protein
LQEESQQADAAGDRKHVAVTLEPMIRSEGWVVLQFFGGLDYLSCRRRHTRLEGHGLEHCQGRVLSNRPFSEFGDVGPDKADSEAVVSQPIRGNAVDREQSRAPCDHST